MTNKVEGPQFWCANKDVPPIKAMGAVFGYSVDVRAKNGEQLDPTYTGDPPDNASVIRIRTEHDLDRVGFWEAVNTEISRSRPGK